MKKTVRLTAMVFLFSSFTSIQPKPRMFEVRVESKIENCSKRHNVIVEAKNIYDAREKAERVVRYKLSTKVITSREIKDR